MPVDRRLAAAAFGDDPGRWPLPAAATPIDIWLRAVAAGGQGQYGCARSDLTVLRRHVSSGPLASLAHSTHASLLRQLGGHAVARGWDGRARALASDAQSMVDALVGLAADALGMMRFAASAALLDRARAALDEAQNPPHRLPIRLQWVTAELAMGSGDGGAAVRHAERACELADASASVRHRVKSDAILAAALCAAGRVQRARAVADDALLATERLGLLPLRWALASLLVDLGSDTMPTDRLRAIRDDCAAELRRRGGVWYR